MRYFILISFLFTNITLACDFSKDIKKSTDGTYIYSADCHIQVGNLVKENELHKQKLGLLEKSIELKDLALTKQEERVQLWMNTTYKLEDRVNTIEQYKSANQWLFFGFGVGVTVLSVWAAGQLSNGK